MVEAPFFDGYVLASTQFQKASGIGSLVQRSSRIDKGYFRQCFAVCPSLDKTGCISVRAVASPFARSAVI